MELQSTSPSIKSSPRSKTQNKTITDSQKLYHSLYMYTYTDTHTYIYIYIYIDLFIYTYTLDNPCNAYNVGKKWGTARGTEAGTVRGWKSRKLGLDGSRFFSSSRCQDYPGLPRTTQELVRPVVLSITDSCAKHYSSKWWFGPVMISIPAL